MDPSPANLFRLPPRLPPEELFEILHSTPQARLERIVSRGQVTPPGQWYDQDTDEWVALLQGQAQITYGDHSSVDLVAGDYLWIPARCRHRVTFTSTDPPCIWLALHLTPAAAREDSSSPPDFPDPIADRPKAPDPPAESGSDAPRR